MEIHERLKLLRTHLNLTTRAFGASISISNGSVSNMEQGTRPITERTIHAICKQYNVNPEWLINGTEPMFKESVQDILENEEVQDLAKKYMVLAQTDKELIKGMVNSLYEKTSNN